MTALARSPVTAVLGPTNTGKTHLAVERMAAHSSGMIGFPLRLLAREVYDRVVAIKGPKEVALITGEEKILPPDARWFLCTAESMPLRASRQAGSANENAREVAFVALEQRVPLQFAFHIGLQLQVGELQQLDGLLQLGRDHQPLALSKL